MLLLSNITPSVISAEEKSVNIHYTVSAQITYIQYDGTSTTQKVLVGETLKEPKHKDRKGHTFVGWQKKETGIFWDFQTPVEEHMTLVAIYQADTTENKDGTLQVGEGKVSLKIKVKNSTLDIKIQTEKAKLLKSLIQDGSITQDELTQIANGAEMEIVLEVKEETNKISEVSKRKIKQKADGYQIGKYMDIRLVKYLNVNGTTRKGQEIHQTSKMLKIKIKISDNMIDRNPNRKRTYCILRNHEGTVKRLECIYDKKKETLTFETNKFSDYAIAYKDTMVHKKTKTTNQKMKNNKKTIRSPKSGDAAELFGYEIIFIVSAMMMIFLLTFTRKNKDK